MGALAGLVGVILVGAVLIAEGQIYSTWAEWQYFGRSSPYSYRGTTSLLNPELNRLAASPEYWSSLIQNAVVGGVFAFSLVILARRIRESGSAHGWVLGLSPVMFLAGSFCLDLVGYAPWIGAAYRAVGSFGMFAGFVTWTLLTAAAVRRQSAPQFTAAGAQPGTE